MIRETDREVLREIDEPDRWGLVIRHGNYLVELIHVKRPSFMVVGFPIQFTDDVVSHVRRICADPRRRIEFEFGVFSAASSPLTAFRLQRDREGLITGISISKKIFPLHEPFSISDLDEAIQAVVSVGALVINFLGHDCLNKCHSLH
jgi:hypothetical protein